MPGLRHQQDKESRTTRFLRELFSCLERENVQFCVLRGYAGLPDVVDNDLDTFAARADVRRFESTLRDVAEEHGWTIFRHVQRAGYQAFHLVDTLDQAYTPLHIDMWTHISWRGVEYADPTEILRSTIRHRGIPVASHGSEAAISLLKELLQHGFVKDKGRGKTKRRIRQLLESDSPGFVRTVTRQLGAELAEFLVMRASAGDWKAIERRVSELRFALWRERADSAPLGLLTDWLAFGAGHLRDKLEANGLMICFIGPDGSGKSTIADLVVERLGPLYRRLHRFHSRPGLLPPAGEGIARLRSLLGQRTTYTPPTADSYTAPVRRGRVISAGLLGYYTLDYFLSHPKLLTHRAMGDLVVADRYYYDYVVGSEVTFGLPAMIPRQLMRLLPASSVTFFLDADPQRIFARKPELTLDEINRQNRLFRAMAQADAHLVAIDANRSPDAIVGDILDVLMKTYSLGSSRQGRVRS